MKKILSLLLACTMIFSFAAISVNADGEAYSLKYVDIKVNSTVDPMFGTTSYSMEYDTTNTATATATIMKGNGSGNRSAEVFAIAVSANAVFAAGQFGLTWDSSVITPAFVMANPSNGMLVGQVINDLNPTYNKSQAFVIKTVTASEAIYEVDGCAMAWSMNGGLAANTDMLYIHFAFNDGKSKDDLNAESIKFGYAESVLATATDAAKGVATQYGAAYLLSNDGDKYSAADASNANRNYPNSDEPATPAGPTETTWTVADENASATVVYDAPVSGKTMIAVYAEDGSMIGFSEGTTVEAQTSFTISTTYEGTANQAKVFVWNGYTAAVAAKLWK